MKADRAAVVEFRGSGTSPIAVRTLPLGGVRPASNAHISNAHISVVVIDDHTMLRVALCDMLRMEGDIEVVADVADGRAGVEKAGSAQPDVVVLDVEIPGEDVTVTVRRLREMSPRSRILIVSMHQDIGLIRELADAGISGYLHKSASRESLLSAIRGANSTVIVMSAQEFNSAAMQSGYALTDREVEVIGHVADALSNRQIASRLGISEGTVKRHLRNIFEKLDAVSRLDAANRAIAAKLIKPR